MNVASTYDSFTNPYLIIFGFESGTSNSNFINIKTETEDVFTGAATAGTDIGESSTGCDALYFYAFSDAALTTVYSDTDISLTAADTISPEDLVSSITQQNLVVNTAIPFVNKYLYLQGKNTGNYDTYSNSNAI